MTTAQPQRPKRLWLAALISILTASLSLIAALYLALSDQVPEAVRLTPTNLAIVVVAIGLLIVSSVFALMRRPWARWLMLAMALLFYGSIVIQNLLLYPEFRDAGEPVRPLVANVVRNSISIAITLWALLSAKTHAFFATGPAPPGSGAETS